VERRLPKFQVFCSVRQVFKIGSSVKLQRISLSYWGRSVLPIYTGNRATFIIINWFSQEFGDREWRSCDILGFNYDPHFLFSGFYNNSGCVYKSQKMFRPCPLVVAILVPLWSDVPPPTIHPWSSQVICDGTCLIGGYSAGWKVSPFWPYLGKNSNFMPKFGQFGKLFTKQITTHQVNWSLRNVWRDYFISLPAV